MFDKIITINLNPSLDTTLWVEKLDYDEPVKAIREVIYPGGKAINLSRVLTSLGIANRCIGFAGNHNKNILYPLLENEKINFDFIEVDGATRENLSIVVADDKLYKINRNGFPLSEVHLEQLVAKLEAELDGYSNVLLLFAGSLPQNVTPQQYKKLILHFSRETTKIAIDTDILTFEDLALIKPFIIKPNKVELSHLAKRELSDIDEISDFAGELSLYVTHVLASLGGDGLVYHDGANSIYCKAPLVEVKSTVGAGDTTLAGFVASLSQHETIENCVRYAVACGTAAVLLEGTGIITKACAAAIYDEIISK